MPTHLLAFGEELHAAVARDVAVTETRGVPAAEREGLARDLIDQSVGWARGTRWVGGTRWGQKSAGLMMQVGAVVGMEGAMGV